MNNNLIKKVTDFYGNENFSYYSNIIGFDNLIDDAAKYKLTYKIDMVPLYSKIGSHFLNMKTMPLGHSQFSRKNKIMTFSFFINNTSILNPSGFRGLSIFKLALERLDNILNRQDEIGFNILLVEACKDEPKRETIYRKIFKKKNMLIYDFENNGMQSFFLTYKKSIEWSIFLWALKNNLR